MREKKTFDLDWVEQVCKDFETIRNNTNYGYGYSHTEILKAVEALKALGRKWGDPIATTDFRVHKGWYLTNSANHVPVDNEKWIVEWDNGNVGRLMFGHDVPYEKTEEEWQKFRQTLLSYDPIDYDPLNCHMIFDIENGKRLMEDYPGICDRTREAMGKIVKAHRAKQLQKELEELQKEEDDE